MKKELKEYTKKIDDLIQNKKVTKDIVTIHLDKIAFFQHERLIHLIVTCLFSILTILVLICLLIPYILHYYYLENGVQYLYKQYDKLIGLDAKVLKK